MAGEEEKKRLTWKDYVALVVAAFEVYSLPFAVIIGAILAIMLVARFL